MAFNTIVTRRLILRLPRIDDLADFLAYRNHPENLRFQPVEPMAEANAAAWLAGQATIDTSAGQCWMMCAVERRTDGRMVGEAGVFLSPPIERTGEGRCSGRSTDAVSIYPAVHRLATTTLSVMFERCAST